MKKKLWLTTFIAIFLFGTVPFNCVDAQENPAIKKEVIVQGTTSWKEVGIKIKPTDKVVITASGKVYFEPSGSQSGVDPNGWPRNTYKTAWPENWNFCDDPYPEFGHAALMGKIGENSFLVGQNKTITGLKGVLGLGINDCTLTGQYSNSGQFKVLIKVYRKK